ncbi:MAG TPA: serine hydrolase [Candidatus Saccharimonadales bacterium]|nr:serine hydrolase [Candidatus Saccharimonadales bacterium]
MKNNRATFKIAIFLFVFFTNIQYAYSVEKTSSEVKTSLTQYLAVQARQGQFSGSVLIAKNDEVIFEGAYGLASREYNVRNKIDTKFNLASKGSPAGGGFSTTEDMFKFAIALRTNKLLNPHFTQLVLATQIAKPNDTTNYFEKTIPVHGVKYLATFSQYGFAGTWNNYGFAVWQSPSMLGHTGGTSGIDNYFGMSPDNSGYTIVILSNQTGPGRMKVLHEIQKLLSFPIQSLNL